MRSASAAVAYARRFTSWRTQYCLNAVQSWLGAAWMGPHANYAWQHARHKRTDRNPPAGVPVYILGSHYGHVALSVGGGRIRSTDWPSRGRVGECSISQLERAWGRRYAGWTADAAPGQLIPGVGTTTPRPAGSGNTVYVHMLKYGVRDSDSVRHMQRRLISLGYRIPAGPTGNYLDQTRAAVRALQRDWKQPAQYATGRWLGTRQTRRLFRGTSFTIKP